MPGLILISLSAFGASEVRRHGQEWFARLAAQAGADGVEVRGELLVDAAVELVAIAKAVPQVARVYSSPEPLCTAGAGIDPEAIGRALDAAARLGAHRIKMSIGTAAPIDETALHGEPLKAVRRRLLDAGIELVIENDQTVAGGTLGPLRRFFDRADAAGLPLGMTFDLGNWHWTGECALQAAGVFASRVRYVHCKGVHHDGRRWVAVPMAASAAPWRAVLRALPPDPDWAIEYPLTGADLLAVTRAEIEWLRCVRREAA